MEVSMLAKDFTFSPALKGHVERRAHSALSRIRHKVSRIAVRLSDLNGPRGGRDKACLVSIIMPGHPEIVVRDVKEDMYAAIDSAIKRAAHRALRLMTRSRVLGRDSLPKTLSPQHAAEADNG